VARAGRARRSLCRQLSHGTEDNLANLLGSSRFEAMRHYVTFPPYVEVDEISNVAYPASPIHYQFYPVQTTKTSVVGAIWGWRIGRRRRYFEPRRARSTATLRAETLLLDYQRQHRTRIKVNFSSRSLANRCTGHLIGMAPSTRNRHRRPLRIRWTGRLQGRVFRR